ncbi:hypothetical protein XENOCAPTIV_019139, partial [Xenoophorus captivus]
GASSPSEDQSPIRTKDLHICSLCGEIFLDLSTLEDHLKTHEVAENLPLCSPSTDTLRTSSSPRASKKKRNHCCSICSRSFLKPCLLREHMMVHIREGQLADPADKVIQNLPGRSLDGFTRILAPHEDWRSEEECDEGGGRGRCKPTGKCERWRETELILKTAAKYFTAAASSSSRSDFISLMLCFLCFSASNQETPPPLTTSSYLNSDLLLVTMATRVAGPQKKTNASSVRKRTSAFSFLPILLPVIQISQKSLTHTGVRYQCPLCSKSFSRALELTYHIDVHSDKNPYFCSICKKNLSGARIFRKHMRKHESDKPQMGAATMEAEVELAETV